MEEAIAMKPDIALFGWWNTSLEYAPKFAEGWLHRYRQFIGVADVGRTQMIVPEINLATL
jgi:hypothetical protein